MKGAQIGATECGNNWIGYVIDHAPGPMMAVMPTVDTAKKNSKQRIQPLIEECDRLKDKVRDPRSRDSSNTVLSKDFPGGVLIMTGANSAVGLRSTPIRNLLLDEVDGYPYDVDGEGDPVSLALARTRTFSKRKIFITSTPTIAGRSQIETFYEESDQRRYYVPCPRCSEMQWLKWPQIKYEIDPKTSEHSNVHYECEYCHGKIENWEKTKMLAAGEWRAERPEKSDTKTVGFHLSSLYSPVGWIGWSDLVKEWRDAQHSRERLRGFVNTVLGETWKDKGEAPNWKRLYERRETYKTNTIPKGVLFLVCGVDIQKDRIECEVVGFGRNKISWSIDYRVFVGDTSQPYSDCWRSLSELVGEVWEVKKGIYLPIKMMAVDSGYNTQVVYSWCRQFSLTKVIAVKGFESQPVIISQPKSADVSSRGKKLRGGLKMFPVGVNIIKSEVYGWLRLDAPDEGQPHAHGFCHFPEYGEEYFKQLTAEELTIKIVKGYKRYVWEKVRDRNEALDCRIYARAAAAMCGIDRFKERNWAALEAFIKEESEETEENVQKPTKKVTIKRRKSTYWE